MSSARTALIIGGGIAGPAAALALRKVGMDSVVYEAHPIPADEAGAYLILGSNGVDALRVLGVEQAALAVGYPTPGITLCNSSGKSLAESRTTQTLPNPATSHTFRRADLYRVMHDAAVRQQVPIEYGKRLVSAVETPAGVRAAFADGTEATADILIGGDGLHSTVRTIIDPAAPPPTYAGIVTAGGYTKAVPVDIEPGSYRMIFGKRAFFGYSMAPDREVWWFAYMSQPVKPDRAELQGVDLDQWRKRLLTLFADDPGPASSIIEATHIDELITPRSVHAMLHLPTWHTDRMVVIGDAAHAPSPTSGQGASLSVEDAVVLAQCLRDKPTAAAAFATFESLRRGRVERIIKDATRINASTAVGPVARIVRDAVLPTLLRLTTNGKAQKMVYDYRIDWDARVA
jgi:FAD-dependent urate hydroxylase